jgi:hypothetical protein
MTEQTMKTIDELQAVVDAAEDALRIAVNELNAAKTAASPVQVGDIVSSRGHEYMVTSLEHRSYGCWYYGKKKLKDGSFGIRATCLFGGVTPISKATEAAK